MQLARLLYGQSGHLCHGTKCRSYELAFYQKFDKIAKAGERPEDHQQTGQTTHNHCFQHTQTLLVLEAREEHIWNNRVNTETTHMAISRLWLQLHQGKSQNFRKNTNSHMFQYQNRNRHQKRFALLKGIMSRICQLLFVNTRVPHLTPYALLLAGGYTPLHKGWCPETSRTQQNKKLQTDTDTTTHF